MPLLISFCLSFGFISLFWGKDLNWDLLNYHLYGPYAALNGRINVDIAPAQIQTYINPLFDFPFYFLFSLGISDKLITFIMGAYHGLGGYLLYKLSLFYFDCRASFLRGINQWISIIIGLTGAAGFSIIGSTMIGWEPTILILLALIACLKGINSSAEKISIYCWSIAGLALGVATGGKLTSASYMVAIVFGLLLVQGVSIKSIKQFTLLGVFATIGIVISAGWWALLMQQNYESPLFPFFNNIIKSPWAQFDAMRDERFLPRSFIQAIFYPFYWLKINHSLVTELDFRDFRFGTIYILLVSWGLMKLLSLFKIINIKLSFNKSEKFILVFFVLSYIIWEFQFSIFRYLLPIEVLAGLIIYILLSKLIKNLYLFQIAFIAIFILIASTTVYPNWGRYPFVGKNYFFAEDLPEVKKDSLLVFSGGDAMAFILPFYDPSIRAISIENNFIRPDQKNLLVQKIYKQIVEFKGPVYSVVQKYRGDELNAMYGLYGLKVVSNTCRFIKPNANDEIRICELSRKARD